MEGQSLKRDTRKTVKTALLNTMANVCSLIVGVIAVPIIARVISQEDLGIASTFLANRNILVIFITMSVYAFTHKAMLEFDDDKKSYIFTISVFCIVMVAIAFLISLPFREQLKELLSLDDFLFYWLFISILSYALYYIANCYCIFHNYSFIVFILVLCIGPGSQFLSIALSYVLDGEKYIGRVIGLDAAYVITAVILLVCLSIVRKKHFRKSYIVRTLKFTVPIIPHLLSQMVLTQCDLIMITYFAGDAASGIYSMGHTVGFLAYTVMSQIMAAWSPWTYRRLAQKEEGVVRQNFSLILLLGVYMTLGLMSISPELIHIFLPASYHLCIYIIPPLVAAMFFTFLYGFLYDIEYYYKKPQWIALTSVVAAVLNLLLNFIYIKKFGYLAACYTTMISYLALFLLNFLFARKLHVEKIYNVPHMFLASAFVVCYMIAMLCLQEYILVRYLLLSVITVVLLIFEHKKIVTIWGIFRDSKQ